MKDYSAVRFDWNVGTSLLTTPYRLGLVAGACVLLLSSTKVSAELLMTLSGQPGDSIVTFELSGSTTIAGFSSGILGMGGTLTNFDAFSPAMGSVNHGHLPLLSGSALIDDLTQGSSVSVTALFLQDRTTLGSIGDRFGVQSQIYNIADGDTVAWSGSGTVDLSSQGASFDDLTIGTGMGYFDAPGAAGELRLTIQLIPEPTTVTLLGLGSLALVMVRRRK